MSIADRLRLGFPNFQLLFRTYYSFRSSFMAALEDIVHRSGHWKDGSFFLFITRMC